MAGHCAEPAVKKSVFAKSGAAERPGVSLIRVGAERSRSHPRGQEGGQSSLKAPFLLESEVSAACSRGRNRSPSTCSFPPHSWSPLKGQVNPGCPNNHQIHRVLNDVQRFPTSLTLVTLLFPESTTIDGHTQTLKQKMKLMSKL